MNRAQATEAAQRGERVERVNNSAGVVQQLKWDAGEMGLLVNDGDWYIERGICDRYACQWRSFEYRIAWAPRTFLGVWQEVKTFAEAEPAGTYDGRPLAVWANGRSLGSAWDGRLDGDDYWVRRMPADASERRPDACDWRKLAGDRLRLIERQQERVKLLDGLLDEALARLDGASVCGEYSEDIRKRKVSK